MSRRSSAVYSAICSCPQEPCSVTAGRTLTVPRKCKGTPGFGEGSADKRSWIAVASRRLATSCVRRLAETNLSRPIAPDRRCEQAKSTAGSIEEQRPVIVRRPRDARAGCLLIRLPKFTSQYGRYGYRRITALLKRDGWQGSAEAEAAGAVVVQRRIVCAAAAGAHQPCMVVRLRERGDARREDGADC